MQRPKSSQRLDYHRLTEALTERGLVTQETMNHILQQCAATGTLLPELLVAEELVSDWELCRVCCEVFNLAYLDVENYTPSSAALRDMDAEYLRIYGIIPLDRYGPVLTIAMPALVPSEVLDVLVVADVRRVVPVVSSVSSNRAWLQENLPAPSAPTLDQIRGVLPSGAAAEDLDAWAGIFDAGDEAVQLELREQESDDPQ